jgi:Flp pilus assembly protein TadB
MGSVNIGYNTRVVCFVFLRSVYCIQCLQLPIPGCPVSFLCLCFVFCLSSFCLLYPMFTAAHCWLSYIIHRTKKNKIHNTNIENRRDNQEWSAVNIGYNKQNEDKQNTQHKHRKLTGQPGYPMFTAAHSWLSRRFSMFVLCILFVFVLCIVSNVYSCPFLVVSSVFYACVVYFACLRSVLRRQTKYTTQT